MNSTTQIQTTPRGLVHTSKVVPWDDFVLGIGTTSDSIYRVLADPFGKVCKYFRNNSSDTSNFSEAFDIMRWYFNSMIRLHPPSCIRENALHMQGARQSYAVMPSEGAVCPISYWIGTHRTLVTHIDFIASFLLSHLQFGVMQYGLYGICSMALLQKSLFLPDMRMCTMCALFLHTRASICSCCRCTHGCRPRLIW